MYISRRISLVYEKIYSFKTASHLTANKFLMDFDATSRSQVRTLQGLARQKPLKVIAVRLVSSTPLRLNIHLILRLLAIRNVTMNFVSGKVKQRKKRSENNRYQRKYHEQKSFYGLHPSSQKLLSHFYGFLYILPQSSGIFKPHFLALISGTYSGTSTSSAFFLSPYPTRRPPPISPAKLAQSKQSYHTKSSVQRARWQLLAVFANYSLHFWHFKKENIIIIARDSKKETQKNNRTADRFHR